MSVPPVSCPAARRPSLPGPAQFRDRLPAALRGLSLIAVLLTLTGCVTRGYKLADQSVRPAVPLNLTSTPIAPANPNPAAAGETAPETSPPSAATLHTVIVYKGSGSWKREAYWDEYVISLTNRAAAPLVVTSANLTGGHADPLSPGENPWAIENLSKKWWETNAARQAGNYLALGAGSTGVLVLSAVSFNAMILGAAAVVAAPIYVGGAVIRNVHSKHQIEAEFTRRRLVLPLTLAPGQTVQGSFFFRITPSPQQLALQCRLGGAPCEGVIDLKPLAGLHLKSGTAMAAAAKR